jgi:hypothetical protein
VTELFATFGLGWWYAVCGAGLVVTAVAYAVNSWRERHQ